MTEKRVLIIGGGVAGLTAALALARFGIGADIVEKAPFAGGHGIQFACKATDRCVKCGACVVEEKLRAVCGHPDIRLLAGAEVLAVEKKGRFSAKLRRSPAVIDPAACTDCGKCKDACPEGAVMQGFSALHHPFYAIADDRCRRDENGGCTACIDACPENAISFLPEAVVETVNADAVIAAHGFTPYSPADKPYGYGIFSDVVTSLELERILRRQGAPLRPSNGELPEKIAFIQCVGSRDARRGRLWCSKICCGSALRQAGLIRHRHPGIEVAVFYIDIQRFGKDFDTVFPQYRDDLRFVRAIPGDVLPAEDGRLTVVYAADGTSESREEVFDLVSLAIGLTPCTGAAETLAAIGIDPDQSGFFPSPEVPGVFAAGCARGPMSIAESVADAGRAAMEAAVYLQAGAAAGR